MVTKITIKKIDKEKAERIERLKLLENLFKNELFKDKDLLELIKKYPKEFKLTLNNSINIYKYL